MNILDFSMCCYFSLANHNITFHYPSQMIRLFLLPCLFVSEFWLTCHIVPSLNNFGVTFHDVTKKWIQSDYSCSFHSVELVSCTYMNSGHILFCNKKWTNVLYSELKINCDHLLLSTFGVHFLSLYAAVWFICMCPQVFLLALMGTWTSLWSRQRSMSMASWRISMEMPFSEETMVGF